MPRQVTVKDKVESTINVTIDTYPNTCPVCKDRVVPIWHVGAQTDRLAPLQLVYQCPSMACRSLFIGYYSGVMLPSHEHILLSTRPIFPDTAEFADAVEDISPSFIKIFNQAFAAEQHELDEIAGIGYRKALEFLVKDYAVKIHPGNTADIKETPLWRCIEDYIDNDDLKVSAERAAWLSNDEAHYLRKWGKDINELKQLIDATVYWIMFVEKTKQIQTDMPEQDGA